MTINAKAGKLMTLVALVLTYCLFSLEQSTSAEQSTFTQSAQSKCKKAKGKAIDVFPGSGLVSTGTITNGGILDGTTETIFNPAGFPTPDRTTVSFIADYSVTTDRGVLKTHNVYLFDFATGLGTAIYRIDQNASTGRFAGATGVLFVSGKSTDGGLTTKSNITGEICLAHDNDNDDDWDN